MRTATTRATLISRILIALTLALVIGATVSQDAFAWKKQARTSISTRNQAQSDLCMVSGGTFEQRDYHGSYTNGHQLQKSVTTCTGGQNPQTCTNTRDYTECTSGFVVQPKGPLDGIAVDEGQISGVDPGPAPQDPLDGIVVDEGQIDGVQQPTEPAPLDPIPTGGIIIDPVRTSRSIPDSNLSPIDPLP